MNSANTESNFDRFRKERRQRRAQFGGLPATAARSNAATEVEAYEAKQVHETRLTRDVHDFLAEATRQAATIVEKVTQVAEAEAAQRLTREMHEFLESTVRRAATFLHMVHGVNGGQGITELETNVSNLVGPALDQFRNEGTAQLQDKHIGKNPFGTSGEAELRDDDFTPDESAPTEAQSTEAQSAEEHVVVQRLRQDVDTMKRGLKALVQAGVLTKEEAGAVYRSELQSLSATA